MIISVTKYILLSIELDWIYPNFTETDEHFFVKVAALIHLPNWIDYPSHPVHFDILEKAKIGKKLLVYRFGNHVDRRKQVCGAKPCQIDRMEVPTFGLRYEG